MLSRPAEPHIEFKDQCPTCMGTGFDTSSQHMMISNFDSYEDLARRARCEYCQGTGATTEYRTLDELSDALDLLRAKRVVED